MRIERRRYLRGQPLLHLLRSTCYLLVPFGRDRCRGRCPRTSAGIIQHSRIGHVQDHVKRRVVEPTAQVIKVSCKPSDSPSRTHAWRKQRYSTVSSSCYSSLSVKLCLSMYSSSCLS